MSEGYGLSIRPMRDADLDAVSLIESAVQRFPWRRQQFQDAIQAGYQAWVLLKPPSDAIIGYAILMPVVDEVELLTLAVAAGWQGNGVGGQLLGWLQSHARGTGMQSMLLEVAAGNEAALNLYRRAGFERIGQRRGYYRAADGSQDDAWVMRCRLAEAWVPAGEAIHVLD
ncbi:MAG: ribosomal protein S18-alanine N-acetyltransferase [Lautropia sp.]|nr:ribosomal protein S18-alanine N-acetyltransferase [Lautropia sp.]